MIAILMALMLTAVLSAHLASWGMATFGLLGWYVATIGIAGASGAMVVGLQLLVRRLRYVR